MSWTWKLWPGQTERKCREGAFTRGVRVPALTPCFILNLRVSHMMPSTAVWSVAKQQRSSQRCYRWCKYTSATEEQLWWPSLSLTSGWVGMDEGRSSSTTLSQQPSFTSQLKSCVTLTFRLDLIDESLFPCFYWDYSGLWDLPSEHETLWMSWTVADERLHPGFLLKGNQKLVSDHS